MAIWLLLRYSRSGRELYAIGGGRQEAIAAGVSTLRPLVFAFAFSGAMGALSGTLTSMEAGGATPTGFASLLLNSVAAAVIGGVALSGGKGSPWGIGLGSLALAVIANGVDVLGAQDYVTQFATGGLLFLVLVTEMVVRGGDNAHSGLLARPLATTLKPAGRSEIEVMKAVVLPGDETTRLEDRLDPSPGFGEVLIRVRASAVCGSDMSAFRGDPVVGGSQNGGIIPGHEVAGEVAELGAGVSSLAVGDRVAIYLAIGCMRCEYCRRGYLMLCARCEIIGFHRPGGDAELIVVPAINCMPLPDEFTAAQGAVVTDMFGTQFSAQARLGVSGTDSVLVFGLGPMGAAAVAVAKARGAHVIGIDPVAGRRELGEKLGADEVLAFDEEELRDVVARAGGVDVVIECSGNAGAVNAALDAVRPFGRVALVGEAREVPIKPSDQLIRKLTTVIGAWYFPIWQFDAIINFMMRRQVPVESIISHRLSLDDAPEAFEMLRSRSAEKMVFEL